MNGLPHTHHDPQPLECGYRRSRPCIPI
jgi:hypothetical protein